MKEQKKKKLKHEKKRTEIRNEFVLYLNVITDDKLINLMTHK